MTRWHASNTRATAPRDCLTHTDTDTYALAAAANDLLAASRNDFCASIRVFGSLLEGIDDLHRRTAYGRELFLGGLTDRFVLLRREFQCLLLCSTERSTDVRKAGSRFPAIFE